MATSEASKPIRYYLRERDFVDPRDPKNASKRHKGFQAIPASRGRIGFRDFCGRLSRGTTFTQQEIEAVINYATEMAREFVANGDIVDFGDLGTLIPTFKSKASKKLEDFNALTHITQPKVHFTPSRKFFDLRSYPGVSFQRVEAPTPRKRGARKASTTKTTKPKGEGGGTGAPSAGDGHLGI